jgi:hypothetical protein
MCWDWYRERELLHEEWTSEDDERVAAADRERAAAEPERAHEDERELVPSSR